MAYSAAADHSFAGAFGKTQFADWNYVNGAMSKRTVQNTNHDMFCPGMSTLQNGQMVVTGGDDAAVVSIYDPATDQFTRAPDMKIARGYQSSCTLSNSNVFTIGGSFTGGKFTKNGEIYNPSSNMWTLLDGCSANKLNTRDND
jgi:galactose oxidase